MGISAWRIGFIVSACFSFHLSTQAMEVQHSRVMELELAVSEPKSGRVTVVLYNPTDTPMFVGPLLYSRVVNDLDIELMDDPDITPKALMMPSKSDIDLLNAPRKIASKEFIGVSLPIHSIVKNKMNGCQSFRFRYLFVYRGIVIRSKNSVLRKLCS